MPSNLRHERTDDGVVTLWLNSPGRSVVVLDSKLLDQIELFFDDLEKQDSPSGFVLASANDKVFVAGADLAEIESLNDQQLAAYLSEGLDVMSRLTALPCPTAAAINGAALGGGLELAMHCDALFAAKPAEGAKPYRVGLPEASLGICPGWGGTQMLPARVDPAAGIFAAATGEAWAVDKAPDGLFQAIVERDQLRETALEWVRSNSRTASRTTPVCIDRSNENEIAAALERIRPELPDKPAAHAVVEAVEIGLTDGWAAGVAAERRLLVSLRHTDIARQRIREFFEKSGIKQPAGASGKE